MPDDPIGLATMVIRAEDFPVDLLPVVYSSLTVQRFFGQAQPHYLVTLSW